MRHHHSHLTITEAVETLSTLADLELDQTLIDYMQISPQEERPTIWHIEEEDITSVMKKVQELFGVILNYFQSHYKKGNYVVLDSHTTEGIQAVMLLIGEAAKKLDRYTALLNASTPSVTNLKEYKKLQEFYQTQIARKIEEGTLSKWILALSRQRLDREAMEEVKGPSLSNHIFVDLDTAKNDSEYELFLIHKEDGTRFFNPRLIRSMKLACDFGGYLGGMAEGNPLESIHLWLDRGAYESAKNILHFCRPTLEKFHHWIKGEGEMEGCITKAILALMMCSNPHQLTNGATKSCCNYFHDFLSFLRSALHTREYQRLVTYPPEQADERAYALLSVLHKLCQALYTQMQGDKEILPNVLQLVQPQEASKGVAHSVWSHQMEIYQSLALLMKQYPNGGLFKTLAGLEEEEWRVYDPLFQNNLPANLFSFEWDHHTIKNIRMPAPLFQEVIQKASIVEEFKGFLRSLVPDEEKCLVINLQDRTSWREKSRCIAIEELQRHPDFEDLLVVVSLTKDTEFYHQEAPYEKENHADRFIKEFQVQLEEEDHGFSFPEAIREQLWPNFIPEMLHQIHQEFFGGRNLLTREHRLNFIEIAYLLLELKIIAIVKPTVVSLMCKDGLDVSAESNALLYIVLHWMQEEELTPYELEQVSLILHLPAIAVRERLLLPERFNRFQRALKALEEVRKEKGWQPFKKMIQKVEA